MATSYYYTGSVSIGVWAKRTAGWQLVSTQWSLVNGGQWASGGPRTFNWYVTDVTKQLGSDVQAVGVTIEEHTGSNAALTTFNKLAWQAQGTGSGVRSATPNGEKTTVTVSP